MEGFDLRRWLPEPSKAVFVFKENNDGSGGHQAHLVKSKQDGVGTLPMLLAGGRRRSPALMTDIQAKREGSSTFPGQGKSNLEAKYFNSRPSAASFHFY